MPTENINLIREEAWNLVSQGKFDLALPLVFNQVQKRKKQLPDLVAIYGCCTAIVLNKRREGIEICLKAKEAAPNSPNQYFLLGLAYMSADLRSKAVEAFHEGLELDPNHTLIKRAISEMGDRQSVPIPFLPRTNPINVMIGRKLHERKTRKKEKAEGNA